MRSSLPEERKKSLDLSSQSDLISITNLVLFKGVGANKESQCTLESNSPGVKIKTNSDDIAEPESFCGSGSPKKTLQEFALLGHSFKGTPE
jgi:hypothetical protein